MVFTNVTENSQFPNQELQLNFSSPVPTIQSNVWLRFSYIARRFGGFNQFLFKPETPTVALGTSNNKHTLLFPPTSALKWSVGDQRDYYLSFYPRGTGDNYINVIPDRIIPSLTATSLYVLSGDIRTAGWYVSSTSDSVEDITLGETREELLYFTGNGVLSSLTLSAGPIHLKQLINDEQFYQFPAATNSLIGAFNHKIIQLAFYTTAKIGTDTVRFKLVPSLINPNVLESIPQNTATNYCDMSAVTGTINYKTGDYTLNYQCGKAVAGSYLEALYIKEQTVPASLVFNLSTPTFEISSNYPLYLYDSDYTVGGTNYDFAFTLGFDIFPIFTGMNTSMVTLTPKMKDFSGQIQYDLDPAYTKWRFRSAIDYDDALSATIGGSTYIIGNWVDGDQVPIKFVSDPNAYGQFTGTVEVSSTNGLKLSYSVEFFTNSSNATIDLSAFASSNDRRNYGLIIDSPIDIEPTDLFYFNYYPKTATSKLTDCDGNTLSLFTPYQYQNIPCISAVNLGIGTTIISLTAANQGGIVDTTELTTGLDFSSYNFILVGTELTACGESNQFLISAYFEDDFGQHFIPPLNGSLCWASSSTGLFSMTALNRDGDYTVLNSCLPSLANDKFHINASIGEEGLIAKGGEIDISVSYLMLDGSILYSNHIQINPQNIPLRTVYGSFFKVLSGTNVLANSRNTINYPLLTGTHCLAFELDDLPFQYDVANVRWDIDDVVTTGVSSISSQCITKLTQGTICANVSVTDITLGGWSTNFCFTDSICFNFFGSNSVDFIAFPKNRYGGSSRLIQNFTNYTGSYGNTAYDCGHTEIFYLSAEPGYDRYFWKIGNYTKDTTSNKTTLGVKGNSEDVGINQTIYVSAFNTLSSTNVPFVGFSDGSSVFKSNVVFLDYFGYYPNHSIDQTVFNLNTHSSEPFNITVQFEQLTASPVSIVNGGTASFRLSSATFDKQTTVAINQNGTNHFYNFSLNKDDFFRIKPNTFNVCNICISADLNLKIKDDGDYRTKSFEVSSQCIPVTAYNGPFLSIDTASNCVSSGVTVNFSNVTPSFLGLTYVNFTFDDGNNNIMSAPTTNTVLTGYYDVAGTYTPILSGELNGELIVKRFKNFIIVDCGSDCEAYNSDVNRTFPDKLKFPYTNEEVRLRPNERLTHLSFNDSMNKLDEIFTYLKNKSKTYSLDVPNAVVGSIFLEDLGKDIIDWKLRGTLIYALTTDGKVKIIDITNLNNVSIPEEQRITVVKNDNIITAGEEFVGPVALDVGPDGDYYIVIDKQSIYVFTFNTTTYKSKLRTYWGGPGSRSARTKFNRPNDIVIGDDESIYISDQKSYIVKKYNKYYNWIGNIQHPDFLKNRVNITSIAVDGEDNLFVLGDNNYVYIFDTDGEFESKFEVENQGSLFVNKAYDGIVYIRKGTKIYKYTKGGIKINQWLSPNLKNQTVVGLEQDGTLLKLLTNNNLYTIFDCLKVEKLRDETLDSNFWSIDSIKIDKDEFVQDWNYNDTFDKWFQNIEMFRRSIKNKFITYPDAFDSTKIIYDMITLEDEDILECDTSDYTIGVNEFVTYDVINRQIDRIYACMETLRDMIKSKPKSASQACQNNCYTWKRMTTNNKIHSNSCGKNPISWAELRGIGITNWYGLSCATASATELELLNWTLSSAVNRVPTYIDNCDFTDK